jgi:prepilin-type N-terminal cleavage/methylation domain-containing protein
MMKKVVTRSSKAFTLVEVMVAVVIISIVVAGLLQVAANSTKIIGSVDKRLDTSTYATLFLGASIVGFEDQEITLDELVKDFKVEDELRQKLKDMKARIKYEDVMEFDSADFEDQIEEDAQENDEFVNVEDEGSEAATLQIGRTSIYFEDGVSSFLRIQLQ